MAADGDKCPRCDLGYLQIDEVEGFLLCASCGYVADELQLEHTVGQGGEFTGVIVSATDTGAGASGGAMQGACNSMRPHACWNVLPYMV